MAVVYRGLEKKLAHMKAVNTEVRSHTSEIAGRAKGLLGAEASETLDIEVGFGETDGFVSLVDTDTRKGSPAAASIEFGHTAPNGTWVDGKWIIHRAAGLRG